MIWKFEYSKDLKIWFVEVVARNDSTTTTFNY